MEELALLRVRAGDTAFVQYVPGNFRPLLKEEHTVCVGAVFRGMACGAALAQRTGPGQYSLRYLFVDPAARLCGLGTYLLRGLLGQVKALGGREVTAMYDPDMLENGGQSLSVLERAGFSKAKAVSTAFITQLGDIALPPLRASAELTVYGGEDLPEWLRENYLELSREGRLPPYADMEGLTNPIPALCAFCGAEGELAGVLLMEARGDGLRVAGLYVPAPFRGGPAAALLIAQALKAAKTFYPPKTAVEASAISREGFALCDKLLRRGLAARKRTEFFSCCYL